MTTPTMASSSSPAVDDKLRQILSQLANAVPDPSLAELLRKAASTPSPDPPAPAKIVAVKTVNELRLLQSFSQLATSYGDPDFVEQLKQMTQKAYINVSYLYQKYTNTATHVQIRHMCTILLNVVKQLATTPAIRGQRSVSVARGRPSVAIDASVYRRVCSSMRQRPSGMPDERLREYRRQEGLKQKQYAQSNTEEQELSEKLKANRTNNTDPAVIFDRTQVVLLRNLKSILYHQKDFDAVKEIENMITNLRINEPYLSKLLAETGNDWVRQPINELLKTVKIPKAAIELDVTSKVNVMNVPMTHSATNDVVVIPSETNPANIHNNEGQTQSKVGVDKMSVNIFCERLICEMVKSYKTAHPEASSDMIIQYLCGLCDQVSYAAKGQLLTLVKEYATSHNLLVQFNNICIGLEIEGDIRYSLLDILMETSTNNASNDVVIIDPKPVDIPNNNNRSSSVLRELIPRDKLDIPIDMALQMKPSFVSDDFVKTALTNAKNYWAKMTLVELRDYCNQPSLLLKIQEMCPPMIWPMLGITAFTYEDVCNRFEYVFNDVLKLNTDDALEDARQYVLEIMTQVISKLGDNTRANNTGSRPVAEMGTPAPEPIAVKPNPGHLRSLIPADKWDLVVKYLHNYILQSIGDMDINDKRERIRAELTYTTNMSYGTFVQHCNKVKHTVFSRIALLLVSNPSLNITSFTSRDLCMRPDYVWNDVLKLNDAMVLAELKEIIIEILTGLLDKMDNAFIPLPLPMRENDVNEANLVNKLNDLLAVSVLPEFKLPMTPSPSSVSITLVRYSLGKIVPIQTVNRPELMAIVEKWYERTDIPIQFETTDVVIPTSIDSKRVFEKLNALSLTSANVEDCLKKYVPKLVAKLVADADEQAELASMNAATAGDMLANPVVIPCLSHELPSIQSLSRSNEPIIFNSTDVNTRIKYNTIFDNIKYDATPRISPLDKPETNSPETNSPETNSIDIPGGQSVPLSICSANPDKWVNPFTSQNNPKCRQDKTQLGERHVTALETEAIGSCSLYRKHNRPGLGTDIESFMSADINQGAFSYLLMNPFTDVPETPIDTTIQKHIMLAILYHSVENMSMVLWNPSQNELLAGQIMSQYGFSLVHVIAMDDMQSRWNELFHMKHWKSEQAFQTVLSTNIDMTTQLFLENLSCAVKDEYIDIALNEYYVVDANVDVSLSKGLPMKDVCATLSKIVMHIQRHGTVLPLQQIRPEYEPMKQPLLELARNEDRKRKVKMLDMYIVDMTLCERIRRHLLVNRGLPYECRDGVFYLTTLRSKLDEDTIPSCIPRGFPAGIPARVSEGERQFAIPSCIPAGDRPIAYVSAAATGGNMA